MRYAIMNLNGQGDRRIRVFDLPAKPEVPGEIRDYWGAVTNVPCPVCETGIVRWAENGYVPGYRICDCCGRHFLATGTVDAPALLRFLNFRSCRRFDRNRFASKEEVAERLIPR